MAAHTAAAGPSTNTQAYLAAHNQHDLHRPFKRVPTYSTSSSGRKRNYKQIIALEQEAHFGLPSTSKNSKKKGSGGAVGDGKLAGAAAKAAKRKEDRLKREAKQAANSTTASTRASPVGDDSVADADTSVADATFADNTPDPEPERETEEAKQAREKEEKERARKRALPTFLSVEAPPSLRPAKKYCDVTGLLARYTDPNTGLRYHSAEIYEIIKTFGPGVDEAYLALRGTVHTLV